MDLFKEIVPSILEKNKHTLNSDDEKDYVPYIVNKALMTHIDCLHYVNLMNMNHHLDKKLQYDFYYHSIKKYKRKYQKWTKYTESDDVSLIKEYFNYSTSKAKQTLALLNNEQISKIREILDKGGKN